ncbi:transcription elongation factor A N-terminal and central domain-containing protein 2-like isoform X2 [Limulus polyphemus]|nr:transcription elongation factor A N-terminal and central domain-containing protein 2-like isoform X2 [Limulus polyphemus]XP_022253654.1 transcription elongation factor A N-terminal and central domain-containing protein 2-like isoform X2 [Limulus polyphemus]XP_022253655.1 transcription elongation factor A N-terminal and central domain-containing protein 2-like isoform X2 [Limulus polyphemus]
MDKYVIRKPENLGISTESKSSPGTKQATLESLKGVVVIEEIIRHKTILELRDQTTTELIKSLMELSKKQPSKEILISTGIGRTVHKLCKHKEMEVVNLAQKIYQEWKKHVLSKHNQPLLEVRCDLKTQEFRQTARKWLVKALGEQEDGQLAEALEREIFHISGRLVKGMYRRHVRKVVFTLQYGEKERKALASRQLSLTKFVAQCKK